MLSLHKRRLFTAEQRTYIFDRADGRCEHCRCALDDSWEADHIVRFKDGGLTTVSNAQALCKQCHVLKTRVETTLDVAFRDTLTGKTPRKWQKEALVAVETVRLQGETNHFAVNATPGAGKSLFMQLVARHFLDKGLIDTILCLVPTDTLRKQGADSFKEDIGIQLVAAAGALQVKDTNGAIGQVVTYQQLSHAEHLDTVIDYWTRDGKRLFVIADEIHHAADHADSSWGEALNYALERAQYALLLSGTLWRTDLQKIPGIPYLPGSDQELLANPHFSLSLREATEEGYVTPVWFDITNIKLERKLEDFDESVGDLISVALNELGDKDADVALREIVNNPHLEGVKALLADAHKSLVKMRTRHMETYGVDSEAKPPPAGLVVCMNKKVADATAAVLMEVTGKRPVIVHGSVGSDCKKRIKTFSKSDKEWIVSVGMISEGVDIPRIKVIAYLTNKKTKLIFSQIVGRAQRTRTDQYGKPIEEAAKVYMPAHYELETFSEEFLEEQGMGALEGLLKEKPEKQLDKNLEKILDELKDEKEKEQKVVQQLYRVVSTNVVGHSNLLNGEYMGADDAFFQAARDLGIDQTTAIAFHKRALDLGLLSQCH